jgi:hypothetical protein
MREFFLRDLSDAGQLHDFKTFYRQIQGGGQEEILLRIQAKEGFMPSALYWHWSLRRYFTDGVMTMLDGHVWLPGLIVWTASSRRRISPETRILTGEYSPGTREYVEASEKLVQAMVGTEAERKAGLLEQTAQEWLTRRTIIGPEQLRRVFWIPPGT